jgi:lipid II:glycine glycyltransferase (peptidoglycan interpeptide bridge formation enzyme)
VTDGDVLRTHFLQSEAWGRFQESLGRTVVRASGDGWRALAILEKGRINSRLYAPYGPVIEDAAALAPAIAELTALARQHGATFLRLEPIGEVSREALAAQGLRPVNHVQPDLTWRIDLTTGQEAVLAGTTKTIRNLYRNFEKKGLSIRRSTDPADIEVLVSLIASVGERKGLRPHPASYFRAQARELMPDGSAVLYFAESGGAPVAASFVYDDEVRRYYAHAGADEAFRSVHPGNVLVTRMILDAIADGKREFDFYGVSPADEPDHAWAGFSRFKRSFGGFDYAFAGTWELPVNTLGYAVYRALRRVTD